MLERELKAGSPVSRKFTEAVFPHLTTEDKVEIARDFKVHYNTFGNLITGKSSIQEEYREMMTRVVRTAVTNCNVAIAESVKAREYFKYLGL